MPRPSRECHACPHNGKRSTACLTCKSPDSVSNKGQSIVSFQRHCGEGSADDDFPNAVKSIGERTADLKLSDCCADTARRLMATFLSLNDDECSVVRCMLRHKLNYNRAARENGYTRQAMWKRVQAISTKHPEFRALLRQQPKP